MHAVSPGFHPGLLVRNDATSIDKKPPAEAGGHQVAQQFASIKRKCDDSSRRSRFRKMPS